MESDSNPYHAYILYPKLRSILALDNATREERFFRCPLVAIELSLQLLASVMKDSRSAARREGRIDTLVESILSQLKLVSSYCAEHWPATEVIPKAQAAARSGNWEALLWLDKSHHDRISGIVSTYASVCAKKECNLGLEYYACKLAKSIGEPGQSACYDKTIAYEALILPEAIDQLGARGALGDEDTLFSTIHQIVECWAIVLIDSIALSKQLASMSLLEKSGKCLRGMTCIFNMLCALIRVLGAMVMKDYHPLRVALRGASGAQSVAVKKVGVRLLELLDYISKILEAEGLSFSMICESPEAHVNWYHFINEVSELEEGVSEFYYHHYRLALRVNGYGNLGALGQGLTHLTRRFIEPLCKELDAARFQHVVVTNFLHGKLGGRIVLERLMPRQVNPPRMEMGSDRETGIAGDIAQRYVKALAEMEFDSWICLLDSAAHVEDPEGTRPYCGRQELEQYFRTFRQAFHSLEVRNMSAECANDRSCVVVSWQGCGTSVNKRTVVIERVEEVSLNGKGLVCQVIVRWNPDVFGRQLMASSDMELQLRNTVVS